MSITEQIDTFKETTMSVDEAAKHVAKITKRKANRNMILRWMNRGVGGVVLASIRIGGEIYTSREKLNLFMNESRKAKKKQLSNATKTGIKASKLREIRSQDEIDAEADELGI